MSGILLRVIASEEARGPVIRKSANLRKVVKPLYRESPGQKGFSGICLGRIADGS
jgi:hypothetical protein